MKKRALPPCGLHLELDPSATDNLLFRAVVAQPVPSYIDHRCECTPASDQGATSECTAFALTAQIEYWKWKLFGIKEQINPHPVYVRSKEIDGIKGEGSTLHAAIQAAVDLGLMDAPKNVRTIQSAGDMKRALHRYDVVLTALAITDKWFGVRRDGWLAPGGSVVGGHAVLSVGYSEDEDEAHFACQTSWNESFGWNGFLRLRPKEFQDEFKYAVAFDVQLPGR